MAANCERKVDNENRQFNDDWTVQCCFVQHQTNVICLLCHLTVAFRRFPIYGVIMRQSIKISTTLSGTNKQLELNL
ncbi:hypothetical protein ACJMK2_041899 [Sinanodonta woodiana]|uniref:Uncharacterized protein n=1 Tax=Sinanodonta woodiana TaxID=1069815 RepID=A0ABD3W8X5_SINWO